MLPNAKNNLRMRNYLLLWIVSVVNSYKASNSWRHPRGGDSSRSGNLSSLTDNDDIDRFIDNLIASVETSDSATTVNNEDSEQEDSFSRQLSTSQQVDTTAEEGDEEASDSFRDVIEPAEFGSNSIVNAVVRNSGEAALRSDTDPIPSENNAESEEMMFCEQMNMDRGNEGQQSEGDVERVEAKSDHADSDDETDSDDEVSVEHNTAASELEVEIDSDSGNVSSVVNDTAAAESVLRVGLDKEIIVNSEASLVDNVKETIVAPKLENIVDDREPSGESDVSDEVGHKKGEIVSDNVDAVDLHVTSKIGRNKREIKETETDRRVDRKKDRIPIPRPHPPNAVYRFLLRQGRIGHTIVMLLVLIVEWIHRYFPTLINVLGAVVSRVLPQSKQMRELPPSSRRNAVSSKVKTVSSRTGQSGKKRKAITSQADQVALAQLRRIGNVDQAKYCHVSDDFMRRHGLGAYAKKSSVFEEDNKFLSVADDAEKVVNEEKYDDDEEEDWVSQALIEDKPKRLKPSVKPSIMPTLAVEVGSGTSSVAVGVEFGFGESTRARQAVAQSVASRRKKRKVTSVGPRASDKDGGDGLLGRIRAASGANSMVSRSLLGAYPGDAVPPGEAASSRGVIDLARKYGWGEWSDDDEDVFARAPTRRKKRRRLKTGSLKGAKTHEGSLFVSRSGAGKPWGSEKLLPVNGSRGSTHDGPLSNSLLLRDRPSSRKKREVKMIHPAMELLNETKRELKNNENEQSSSTQI